MDLLDYLPFIQFIRDDKETVNIMKHALKIVPRVCNILDLDTTARAQQSLELLEPSSYAIAPPAAASTSAILPSQAPSTSASARLGRTGEAGSGNVKRKTSTKSYGSGRGVKRSGTSTTATPAFSAAGSPSLVLPLKKRKLSNGNVKTETVTGENQSHRRITNVRPAREDVVRKLQEDYDTFIRQVGELASLEREKNTLLEKFLVVSSAMTGSENPNFGTNNSAETDEIE